MQLIALNPMVPRTSTFLAVAIVLVLEAGLCAQVRSGAYAERLSNSDVAEITRRAASVGKSVVLLDGDVSQVLPETWYIDAYLEADSTSAAIHRGRVLRLESEVVEGKAVRWRTRFPVTSYARVPTSPTTRPSGSLDRPFLLDGSFSDEELIGLINYIRTSPQTGAQTIREAGGGIIGGSGFSVEGTWPVTSVGRSGNDVRVWLQNSTRSGQTVTLIRERGRWVAVHVVMWIA
jgi:hypothetical protein